MSRTRITINKSDYLNGLGCQRALWLMRYHPELTGDSMLPVSFLADEGIAVGELARQEFPSGILILTSSHPCFFYRKNEFAENRPTLIRKNATPWLLSQKDYP